MAIAAQPSQARAEIIVCDDASRADTPRVLGGVPRSAISATRPTWASCGAATALPRRPTVNTCCSSTTTPRCKRGGSTTCWRCMRAISMRLGRRQAGVSRRPAPGSRGHHLARRLRAPHWKVRRSRQARIQLCPRGDCCSGACLLIKSALFRQLGGFDDCYAPAYYGTQILRSGCAKSDARSSISRWRSWCIMSALPTTRTPAVASKHIKSRTRQNSSSDGERS